MTTTQVPVVSSSFWTSLQNEDESIKSSSWSYKDTTAIAFFVIGLVIYLPLTIHFAYPIWRAKRALIFQKRQSKLTLYAIYALLINIITTSILQPIIWHVGPFSNEEDLFIIIIRLTLALVQQLSWQFFYSTLFVRLWLFYYGIRYNMITGNDWKAIIDNDYDSEQSYLVRAHSTLGNETLLININWIFNILLTLTDATIFVVDIIRGTNYSDVFALVSLLIIVIGFWIFSSIIYCLLIKVKYFDDLYILKEFKVFYKVVMTAILVVFIYFLVLLLVLVRVLSGHGDFLIFLTLHFLFQMLLLFHISIIYVMTRWVFNQLFDDESLKSQYGAILKQASTYGFVSSHSMSKRDEKFDSNDLEENEDDTNAMTLTIFTVFQRYEYLCEFMQHLSHEFSLECILSVIEFVQFREMFASDPENNDIKLPSKTPKSSIVFNKEYDREIRARQLYLKYIAIGSDYEINISAKDRNIFKKKYNSESFGDPHVFDKSIQDMISLLRYSFVRFQNKAEYDRMQRFASFESNP